MLVIALLVGLALSEAPDHDRWLNTEVVYILSARERKEFSSLQDDASRDRFIEDFWKRRDPDPSTAINEYKVEHYRRLEYVANHFGDEGKPGWKTVRGRTYIVQGPPDDIRYSYGYLQRVSVQNPTQILNPMGEQLPFVYVQFPTPASETWVYRYVPGASSTRTFFTVIFAKMDATHVYTLGSFMNQLAGERSGGAVASASQLRRLQRDQMIQEFITKKDYFRNDYRIVYAGDPRIYDLEDFLDSIFNPRAGGAVEQLASMEAEADLLRSPGEILERLWGRKRRMEELVSSQIYYGTIDVNVTHGLLKDSSGQVRIPFQARVELPEDIGEPEEIDLYVELLDSKTSEVIAQLQDVLRPRRSSKARVAFFQSRLSAPAGDYRLRFVACDLKNQVIGLWEERIQIPDLTRAEFDASPLLVCDRVVPAEESESQLNSLTWVSNYQKWSPLAFDDRIFIPSMDRRFRRIQDLTTLVEIYNPTMVSEKPDVTLQAAFLRNGKPVAASSTKSLDYITTGAGSIIYALSLPLKGLDTGDYELVVDVLDRPSGKAVRRSSAVSIW